MSETPAEREDGNDLSVRAFLYYTGELEPAQSAAFERLLGEQEEARDALVGVVRMTLPVVGAPSRPDPSYRRSVRERLRGGWWHWLVGRQARRGHPLLWAVVGAAAAALLFLGAWPRTKPAGDNVDISRLFSPAAIAEPEPAGQPEDLGDAVYVWADLNNTDHLERAVADEQKRRSRAEDRRQVHVPHRNSP